MPLDELDHELRATGWTSTDFAALLGVDEERDLHSAVVEKVYGRIPLPVTDALLRGKYLERGILDWWSHKSGKAVEPLFSKTFRHPKYEHVLASPDALVVGGNEGLEIKTLSQFQGHKYGASADDMPPKTQLQAVVCMEVMNKDSWRIILYWADRLRDIEMERDREFGEWVCAMGEEMWDRYAVRKEMPPIGGSKISAAYLQQRWPNHKRPDLRVATDEEIEQLRRYGRLRAEQKDLAKQRATLENQIKDAIKDREGLVWEGGRFTWRRAKDSKIIDWESMAIALRTHYLKDEAARVKLTEDYTHTKPGSRRIYFSSDEFIESEETADAA